MLLWEPLGRSFAYCCAPNAKPASLAEGERQGDGRQRQSLAASDPDAGWWFGSFSKRASSPPVSALKAAIGGRSNLSADF